MPLNGKRRNYRKKRGVKKTYKKRANLTLATKRYIKRTIHSQIENKTETDRQIGQVITSYNISPTLWTESMIPYVNIPQGTGQGERIGNVIRTMKCVFKYVLYPAPYSVALNPIPLPNEVMVFFGKVKNSRAQQPVASDYARLFQSGETTLAPTSQLMDLILDINKDWWTIYKVFRHKIGRSITTGTGNNIAASYYANNDFKLNVVKSVNLTKHCPKLVRFNDGTSQPTNDGLWAFAMCVNADGSFSNFNQAPVAMDYSIHYSYEDA